MMCFLPENAQAKNDRRNFTERFLLIARD